jgi:tRNA dimethylallyltransferase
VPLLAGGTGLYYSSLADNITFFEEEADLEYRRFLFERAEKEGAQVLYDELLEADPERAQTLHINDLNRIIRALEILHTTGKSITLQNKESKLIESPFEFRTVCLDAKDRQFLYDRINARVDIMMENGLLEEAERFLHSDIGNTAVQAIGYKELRPYYDGTATLDECIENLKMQTRRYAKRQLTWFRREKELMMISREDYENDQLILEKMLEESDAILK